MFDVGAISWLEGEKARKRESEKATTGDRRRQQATGGDNGDSRWGARVGHGGRLPCVAVPLSRETLMGHGLHGSAGPASIWMTTATLPKHTPLGATTQADVCVVGAGIAGMTTAYLLAREGRAVVVLDDGPVAGGMTQHTTAHLSNAIDDRYVEIERMHGEQGAAIAAASHTAAIDRIEATVREESIDCDFARVDGYLFLAPGDNAELLHDELTAAHRAGLVGVGPLDRAPLDGFDTGPCLRFPEQAQFHPLRYLAALDRAIERMGGRIFTGSHVDEIEGGADAHVKVGPHAVAADAVVVATNTPINDRLVIHTKQAPYLTYTIGARIPKGSVKRALYWDTGFPYHYIRIHEMDEYDV